MAQGQLVDFISGMALGLDMVAAMVVIRLRGKGFPVRLIAAVPFLGQTFRWGPNQTRAYEWILQKADEVHVVVTLEEQHDKNLGVAAILNIRNHWMVDRASLVMAAWDGSSGGTANCVKYANRKNKRIFDILDWVSVS